MKDNSWRLWSLSFGGSVEAEMKLAQRLAVLFPLSFTLLQPPKTNLANIFQKKMEQIQSKKQNKSPFTILFLTSRTRKQYGSYQLPIARSKWIRKWFFQTLNANYTMKRNGNLIFSFAITIRMVRTFNTYKNPQVIYTL